MNISNIDGVSGSAEAVLRAIAKRQAEEAEACRRCAGAWERFAVAHGLEPSSDDEAATRRAEGTTNDVRIAVEVVKDDDGWRHTLVTAEAKVPSDVVVAIHPSPKGILNMLKSALLGKEDVCVGDPDFDRRFLVHSEPRTTAQQMLDDAARALVNAWCGNTLEAILYERGTVYVQSAGVETDETALACALAIAVRLASWRPGPQSAYR